MPSKPTTVKELLASLPPDRREAIEAVRATIKKNIDKRFKEGIQYGMLGWFLPHSEYPEGYHCDPKQPVPFVSVASQKNHIGLYLFCVYTTPGEPERFAKEWKAAGKKLDMGKSCVRVKKLEDIPLPVLAKAIKRNTAKKFVAAYEASLPESVLKKRAGAATKKKAAPKKKAASKKKPAAKKATAKKAAKKKTVKKAAAKKKAVAKKATKKKAAKKPAAKKKAGKKRATKKKASSRS